MSDYTFEGPHPVTDDKGLVVSWLVYIVKDGLLTGEAGNGDTPQAAREDAEDKVNRGAGGTSGD